MGFPVARGRVRRHCAATVAPAIVPSPPHRAVAARPSAPPALAEARRGPCGNRSLHNRVIRSSHHDLASESPAASSRFPHSASTPISTAVQVRIAVAFRLVVKPVAAPLLQLGEHGERGCTPPRWAMIRQRSRRPKNAWGRVAAFNSTDGPSRMDNTGRRISLPRSKDRLPQGCRRRDLRFVVLPSRDRADRASRIASSEPPLSRPKTARRVWENARNVSPLPPPGVTLLLDSATPVRLSLVQELLRDFQQFHQRGFIAD